MISEAVRSRVTRIVDEKGNPFTAGAISDQISPCYSRWDCNKMLTLLPATGKGGLELALNSTYRDRIDGVSAVTSNDPNHTMLPEPHNVYIYI
jgi:hypothetical protein